MPNQDKEQIKQLKKTYIYGAVAVVCLLAFIFAVSSIPSAQETFHSFIPKQQEHHDEASISDSGEQGGETVIIQQTEDKEQKIAQIEDFTNDINSPTPTSHPDTIALSGKQYFIFERNILMPFDSESWIQYDVPAKNNYSAISEFYQLGEVPSKWTQKATIHKVSMSDKDCYALADKIVNGLIVSYSNQMEVNGKELTKENLSVNYVKKNPTNTELYWEHKGIVGTTDEVQFLRVFISEYSGEMYLVTYTIKGTLSDLDDSAIVGSLKVIESVQQLKEKG